MKKSATGAPVRNNLAIRLCIRQRLGRREQCRATGLYRLAFGEPVHDEDFLKIKQHIFEAALASCGGQIFFDFGQYFSGVRFLVGACHL
jgi:hypothetical protein